MGKPVVTTSGVCRALAVEPNKHLLVGDSDQSLAKEILSLLASEDKRRRFSVAGRQYVEMYHDWDRIAAQIERVYEEAQG